MSFSWLREGPTTGRAVFVCQLLVCFLLVGCLCCILSVFGFAFSICISSVRFLFFRYAVCLSGGSELRCLSFFVGRVVSVRESGVLGTTLSSPAQKGRRSSRLDQQRKRGKLPSAGWLDIWGVWDTWRIGPVGWSDWRNNTCGWSGGVFGTCVIFTGWEGAERTMLCLSFSRLSASCLRGLR